MFRLSALARRSVSRTTAIALGGATTAVAATTTLYYSENESVAGLRREALFWSKVGPVVFDYYWKTASSSPLVKYQAWMEQQRDSKTVLNELHEQHAPEIFQTLLDLKGLYVKLGQVLSVTALPIPEPYRVLFRTLQSDVPGWEDFEQVVRPVLKKGFHHEPLDQIFASVDPVPCGAASIGQAHRATLLNGDQVIVKVQYPDAAWQVPADIQCVGDFMRVCVWFGVLDESAAKLSFDEFARQFLAELDYNQERANLEEVYQSSLDSSAPYIKRNVVIPKPFKELCTNKIITMTYLPGPKLEEEARRQLALLGIDTKGGIKDIIRDAANNAAKPNEEGPGELMRRVTKRLDTKAKSPFSSMVEASSFLGRIVGVDALLWAVRSGRRLVLWSQAVAVASMQVVPRFMLPTSLNSWAEAHRTAASQAAQLTLTKQWIEALFDVHGHQIFNLGCFNADPHPGNILVVEEQDGTPGTKLGLIDYGQCKRLTPREQVLVARLILSVANNESDSAVAAALRDMKIGTKNDSTDFLAKFGRLMFGPFRPEHLQHSWHRKLHETDRVVYFPNELSMVYRTSLLLRGLAISLQLNYAVGDMWKHHAQDTVNRHPEIVREIVNARSVEAAAADMGEPLTIRAYS